MILKSTVRLGTASPSATWMTTWRRPRQPCVTDLLITIKIFPFASPCCPVRSDEKRAWNVSPERHQRAVVQNIYSDLEYPKPQSAKPLRHGLLVSQYYS
ncbi:hypothetical protein EVAR_20485_1 [Eumeta japonica]|uniref:Uncharacterized protein n=1 Tax=Eumeta variegata TaxID=151549 RepID=A0A4C1YA87_EUMVA|nr:hypothetical protein EVAR_20485_1 [Eumeta japonica]